MRKACDRVFYSIEIQSHCEKWKTKQMKNKKIWKNQRKIKQQHTYNMRWECETENSQNIKAFELRTTHKNSV